LKNSDISNCFEDTLQIKDKISAEENTNGYKLKIIILLRFYTKKQLILTL
jgi:hypothetical protein